MKIPFLALALLFCAGCGLTPIQRNAVALDAMADITSGGAVTIQHEARSDRDQHCPHAVTAEGTQGPRDPSCLAQLHVRWDPIDAVVDQIHSALDTWRVMLNVAREANQDPGQAVHDAMQAAIDAYNNLRSALAAFQINIPEIPPIVTEALSALVGVST